MHPEYQRWSRIFSGSTFYYGTDPGPMARRAVRYHRPLMPSGGMALDVGAGEGQDLLFLAASGYTATGLEWTPEGAGKARQLLQDAGHAAEVIQGDFRTWDTEARFDLVLAVNCLQFLGADAPAALEKLLKLMAPGGVVGFSAFARQTEEPAVLGTLYRWTLDEILGVFSDWQPLEAARLWQWSGGGPQEFVTLVAAKR